jgi:hypothetical protein
MLLILIKSQLERVVVSGEVRKKCYLELRFGSFKVQAKAALVLSAYSAHPLLGTDVSFDVSHCA